MKEERIFSPSAAFSAKSHVSSQAQYDAMYRESIEHPETFWARHASENIEWMKKWDHVMSHDFARIGKTAEPYVSFFPGAQLNVSSNCLDRHVRSGKADKAAIIWQGEHEQEKRRLTYRELQAEVEKFARVLRALGVKKGHAVTMFMPMVPEIAIAMLACTRVGAIHSVVFSAFSPDALKSRIQDCQSFA